MGTLEKVFNEAKKDLEALEELKALKDFFKSHDNKVFTKRITDQLPEHIMINLNQGFGDMRLEVTVFWNREDQNYFSYSDRTDFTLYHTGYGKDLGIHPLDENKRIKADNIGLIIDQIAAYTEKSRRELLDTDLEALSKALEALHKAEQELKNFYSRILLDGLDFWPDIYKTERAIMDLKEYRSNQA